MSGTKGKDLEDKRFVVPVGMFRNTSLPIRILEAAASCPGLIVIAEPKLLDPEVDSIGQS